MQPTRRKWQLMVMIAMAAASFAIGASTAWTDDWQRCMTIEQEAERLACLDAAAGVTGRPHPTDTGRDERSVIISRCQAQTGEFGSVMVKACIVEDMAAYEALQASPAEHTPFIEHCLDQLGQHGWGMVRICVERQIEAQGTVAD